MASGEDEVTTTEMDKTETESDVLGKQKHLYGNILASKQMEMAVLFELIY